MDFKPFRGSLNPFNCIDVFKYRAEFKKAHPEYFDPDGVLVFCGAQGQGKTISAISYITKLISRYPDVVLCSNVMIQDQSDYCFVKRYFYDDDGNEHCTYLTDYNDAFAWAEYLTHKYGNRYVAAVLYDDVSKLAEVNNGYGGVIFMIDEMHLEFNSLESKEMDSNIFYTVSQQRKQRIHIVGTAQVFKRLAKPFREQFKYAVMCSCIFGVIQFNKLIDALKCTETADGQLHCSGLKRFLWFHSVGLYESYDTLQTIKRTRKEWGRRR